MKIGLIVISISLALVSCGQNKAISNKEGEGVFYTGGVDTNGRRYTNVLTDQEISEHKVSIEKATVEQPYQIESTHLRGFRINKLGKTELYLPKAKVFLEMAYNRQWMAPNTLHAQLTTNLVFPGAATVELSILDDQKNTVFQLVGSALETEGVCAPFDVIGLSLHNTSACLIGNDTRGHLIFRITTRNFEGSSQLWIEVQAQEKTLKPLLANPPQQPLPDIKIDSNRHALLGTLEVDYTRSEIQEWIFKLWPTNKVLPRFLKLFQNAKLEKPEGEALQFSKLVNQIQGTEFPLALAFVPFAESNFKPKVTSPSGAHGWWQFMPQTAVAYGLKIPNAKNPKQIDQREDLELSTRAALRMYRDMAAHFSWGQDLKMLFAGYNMGQWGLDKKVKQMEKTKESSEAAKALGVPENSEILTLEEVAEFSTNFWELSDARMVPRETRKYVSKIVAALIISLDKDLAATQGGTPIDSQ